MVIGANQRFELGEKLGQGGTSIVYEAYDRIRDMPVAIKELLQVDATRLYAFKREFRAMSDLCHPNIVTLYELVHDREHWFLTMELINGRDFVSHVRTSGLAEGADDPTHFSTTLFAQGSEHTGPAELVARDGDAGLASTLAMDIDVALMATAAHDKTHDTGTITAVPTPRPAHEQLSMHDTVALDRLVDALKQLAGALVTVHAAGLIHRDLKPSNVLVTAAGRVVLVDFGFVAELALPPDPTTAGLIMGTPAFMAPEQVRGQAPSAAADWYAFGVMLYLCLTGDLPFRGTIAEMLSAKQVSDPPRPGALIRDVPAYLDELCMALLCRDPAARPTGAEVLARLGASQPAVNLAPSRRAADIFVGRERQRRALDMAFARVAEGAARVVLVQGPSGMGKSRLVAQFLAQAARDEAAGEAAIILSGRCRERESLAYRAWDGLIDHLGIYLAGLDAIARAAVLGSDAAVLGRLFPVLRKIPEIGNKHDDEPESAHMLVRAGLALRQVIHALAAKTPIIAHIEDLQWADAESLALLATFMSEPPARFMLLATMRSDSREDPRLTEIITTLEQDQACLRVDLGPLSDSEQRALAGELVSTLGIAPIAPEIWRQSGGHPMLLAELVRCAREAPEVLDRAVELGLEGVIGHRIARLPKDARALFEAVAIAGEPTPLSAAAVCAAVTAGERERILAMLRAAQLVRVTDRHRQVWLDVYHDAIRQAAWAGMPDERRVTLHQRMARALELFVEAGGHLAPARLARHWRSANQPARAARYLVAAAEETFAQLAFARAVALWREALALMGEPAAPADDKLADDKPADEILACRAWIGLARGLRMVDEGSDAVLAALDRARPLAEKHHLAAELGEVCYLRGNTLFIACDLDACLAAHQQAHDHALALDSPDLAARALSGMGDAHLLGDAWHLALACYEQCVALCEDRDLVAIAAANLPMIGYLSWLAHDFDRGLATCRRAIELAATSGTVRGEVLAQVAVLPEIFLEMNRVDDARAALDRGVPRARDHGLTGLASHGMITLGRCLLQAGQPIEAQAVLEEALALSRHHRYSLNAPRAIGLLYRLVRDAGQRAALLAEGEDIVDKGTGNISFFGFCADVIEGGLKRGELDLVARIAAKLEAYVQRRPPPWVQLTVARARALAAFMHNPQSRAVRDELIRVRDDALAAKRLRDAQAPSRALGTSIGQ